MLNWWCITWPVGFKRLKYLAKGRLPNFLYSLFNLYHKFAMFTPNFVIVRLTCLTPEARRGTFLIPQAQSDGDMCFHIQDIWTLSADYICVQAEPVWGVCAAPRNSGLCRSILTIDRQQVPLKYSQLSPWPVTRCKIPHTGLTLTMTQGES